MANEVIGTSEAAKKLAELVPNTIQVIEVHLKKISAQSQEIKDAWKARGNECVDEMVEDIRTAISKATADVDELKNALLEYAKFLEEKGM